MKKIYIEPEMEICIFSKQDQIRASATIDPPNPPSGGGGVGGAPGDEDPITDADGLTDGFFWY